MFKILKSEIEFKRFSGTNLIANSIILIGYLSLNIVIGDLRDEHIFLSILWIILYYTNEKTRKFALGFSFFIVFWILYDSMRAIPNYTINIAHIKEPYDFEKLLFGIDYNGSVITPNEYFSVSNNIFFDFLSGFFYINWMPIPLGFGVYLFIKHKTIFIKYSISFLIVNILGFFIYYLYPAAPPWYVDMYGFDLHIGVPGNRAGLIRFDELIGIPIFEGIYNKNANVLAAMPSLHSAYPIIVLFYAIKKNMKKMTIFLFTIFIFGIWFSAVYSSHHYIIDVIAGAVLAIFTLIALNKLFSKPTINKHIEKFSQKI